ncbi:hypothetical protein [Fusobacterium nucleatum]|uniref:hypothetical protein n=1 Tax=Fusobacterium nucleatum TaxID=851 RepID=UPI001EECF6AA|nr:hypothetical protein [Fusobacterium nucleatum]MCG6843041.1 hypothetical protein [Fusobacterium nucleatum]
MNKENKNFDIISFLFNNESFINSLLENLKKELMEVIFSENLSLFKKSIFIQGVFTYANLILSNNTSMLDEEKSKIMQEIVEISNLLTEYSMEDIKRYTN